MAGEITRLMVFEPPRTGKTELVSRRLPAYVLGHNPQARIMACSHTDDFAGTVNRDVQRIMDSDEYHALFPNSRLAGKGVSGRWKRTNDLFEIVDYGGYYRSAGVGGNITGRGFDFGIIDDPIKSAEQADSPTFRQKLWEWYSNDFYSRREAGNRILLTHTRWHRDDLAGRLLLKMMQPGGDQWEIICLPGLKVDGSGHENDPTHPTFPHPDDPRQIGEALWPSQKSVTEYLAEQQQNVRAFAALAQQDPAEGGGAEWPPSLFGQWIWCPPEKWPKNDQFMLRTVAVDPSKGKSDKQGDYSAIVFVGIYNGLLYVDVDMERRPPHEIVRHTILMCDKYQPTGVYFEGNGFQDLLAAEFKRQLGELFHLKWPIYTMVNSVNKIVRIRGLGEAIVDRLLRFKADSPGCRLLVDQLIDFPLAEHDDGPDALEMGIRWPMQRG